MRQRLWCGLLVVDSDIPHDHRDGDRHGGVPLVNCGYHLDITKPSAFKVKGAMPLYSRDRGASQLIESHATAFAGLKLSDGH